MDTSEIRASLADLHAASFGWALACCRGDRGRAEDVLQNAYVKVLEGRARFAGTSSFKTWLFGVIRNSAREERRRRLLVKTGLVRYEPELAAVEKPDLQAARKESQKAMRTLLAKLSPRQQDVLHLVFYQELTIEEAARVMGVSLGSARTHYERGKQRLRKHLETSDDPRS